MSKQVDERVVSMQFDNKNFEQNVSTTMSTLDKLKQKLHFPGATKGLENINSAAKNVNMSGLSGSVETVQAKFSALQVVGVTALANITNSAINAGKRIVSALTIDPVKTGFQEYELKMDSVRTIMASTGESVEKVNEYLNELNKYSDQTIYSFSDMTQNIGKFTNAGVKLEDAVLAIKGISNEAAVSGANANEASRAMYNFAQALSAGYVKLIDWKSIELANMATVEFKQQLIDTAVATGTLTKASDGMYKTLNGNVLSATKDFNETLTDQWMTSEVLIETLKNYSDETTTIGKKAFAAAQEVTKFTQMWDVLKETAQSGWAQTWEIVFGDIEKAKAVFTPLTTFFSEIIDKMSNFRNKLLEGALNNPFADLIKKINGTTEEIKGAVDTVKDYSQVVKEIIRGDWGNTEERWAALTKAGYDWKHAQNLVNEALGCSLRRTTDYVDAQGKQLDTQNKLNESHTQGIAKLLRMSDEQLKQLGYTKEEIKQLRLLAEYADAAGVSIGEFINNIDKYNGRNMLIESFKTIGKSIADIVTAISKAWKEIFPPMTSLQLYKIIAGFKRLSDHLKVSEETADNLRRTFKGVFAVLDIFLTVVGGPIKLVLSAMAKALSSINIDITKYTARIGDAIVAVRDWVDEHNILVEAFKAVFQAIKNAVKPVRNWIDSLKDSKNLPKDIAEGIVNGFAKIPEYMASIFTSIRDSIKNGFSDLGNSSISGFITGFRNSLSIAGQVFAELGKILLEKINGVLTKHGFEEISADTIAGLVNGLKSGASKVWDAAVEFAKGLWEGFCDFMGIHSPSTKMFEAGGYVVEGLANGIQNGASKIWESMKTIGSKIVEFIRNIDFGSILATGLSVSLVAGTIKIGKALEVLATPFEGLGKMFAGAGDALHGLKKMFIGIGKDFKANAMKKRADALKSFAMAIGILVASVYVLTKLDTGKMWGAIGAIAVLSGIMVGLSIAIDKLGSMGGLDVIKFAGTVIAIGAAMLMLTNSMKTLSEIDKEGLDNGAQAIFILTGMLAGLMVVAKFAGNIGGVGKSLVKMVVAMGLLVLVAKLISTLKPEEMIKGGIGIVVLGGIMVGLVALTKLAGKDIDKVGGTLIKMSIALLLMVGVAKLVSMMPIEDLKKGATGIIIFGGIITGLIAATRLASGNTKGIGSTILGISAAILLMVFSAKLLASMEVSELAKGIIAVALFGGIITGLIAATKLAGPNLKGVGTTILLVSFSIGLLAIIATILGMLNIKHLAKGVIAVGLLSAMMAGLIIATKGAQDCKGNIIAMAIAIGVMAAAVAVLSFIDTTKLASATIALSLLMGMFALMIRSTGVAKKSLGTIIVMTLVVGALAGILYLLAQLPIDSCLGATASLSILLLSMSASMLIISKAGTFATKSLIAIGVMTLVVGALAGILYLLKDIPIEQSLGTAKSLSILLLSLSGALVILGVVGLMGPAAFIGIGALATLIVGVGALIVAIGALVTKFPALEAFLDKGIPILEKIGYALGSFFGNIVGGFLGGITSGLPEMANDLSSFMTNLQPFIDGASSINEETLSGINALAKAILILTGADILNSLTSWVTGGNSISEFGSQLGDLGTNLNTFATNLGNFDESKVATITCATSAIKSLAEAAKTIPNEGGLWASIAGDNSLAAFGSYLPDLASNLNSFATNLGTFDESKVTTVTCAADSIKSLAEAAKEIPNEGGIWASIFGDNSISTFAAKLPALGTNMCSFATNLGTFDESKVTTVKCAATAIKSLAKAANEIPSEGGIWAAIFGDNSLSSFGSKLPDLGSDLSSFVTNLGTFTDEQVVTVRCAANAIAAIAKASQGIDGQSEWGKTLFGENGIGAISDKLPGLGENLASFVENLGTFSDEQTKTVTSAIGAIRAFATLADSDLKGANANIEGFGTKLVTFAGSISDFISDMPSTDSIESAVKKVKEICSMIDDIAKTDGKEFSDFADSLGKAGKDAVSKFVKAFTSNDAKTDAKDAAKKLMDKAVDGVEAKEKDLKDAGKAAGEKAIDGFDDLEDNAETAGKDFGKGLVKGINSKQQAAYNAGYALGQKAVQGEKDGQKSNSPSKLTMQAGKWLGEGLINGMVKMFGQVSTTGRRLGETATDTISSAVSRISDAIDSDMDTQPTIRPVLDLSDVESGARTIGSMLNGRVLTNVGSISTMMNRRNQNGANDDVISAIRDLGRSISDKSGDTYTINGVTYDDGSNITEAVKTIVRAARLERRV